MTSLTDLQNQLQGFPCHFIWELEKKSIKQFGSLVKLIDEHISDSPAMVIEGLLFKSYLFFSEFRGNAEKNKAGAIECIEEVRRRIREEDPSKQPNNNGYLAIAIALEAWFNHRDQDKLEANIRELQRLESLYEDGSPEHNMFKGSIHATKGFALTRVGMNRYSESIQEFETALELCPGEKDWLFSVGLVRWRLAKAAVVNRNGLCDGMGKVESIFNEVIKLNPQHSYAMVLIAEIKRRKKTFPRAQYYLKCALKVEPVRHHILGQAASVYRKMKQYENALRVLHIAEKMEGCGSFIFHQLYLVYRDISYNGIAGYSPPKLDYLQLSIDLNPSNLAAKIDRANELSATVHAEAAEEYFNHILDNVENDTESVIVVTYQFATFFQKQNKSNEAIGQFQIIVDRALNECKEDGGPPFTFFREINWKVKKSIESIIEHHENVLTDDAMDIKSRLLLADLEKKLGNTGTAYKHYQQILDLELNINEERKRTILQYLAAAKNENVGDVDGIIVAIKHL